MQCYGRLVCDYFLVQFGCLPIETQSECLLPGYFGINSFGQQLDCLLVGSHICVVLCSDGVALLQLELVSLVHKLILKHLTR